MLVVLITIILNLTPEANADASLKSLAHKKGFLIGSAVAIKPLLNEKPYTDFIKNQFSVITPENAFKFDAIHPERDQYDFENADKIVAFAKKNHILVRGHTLVWHNPRALPDWINDNQYSPEELKKILKDHIQTTLKHFKKTSGGTVFCWDVANEVFDHDGHYRKNSVWGPIADDAVSFLTLVIGWAQEADPEVKLFYNDYNIENEGKKTTAVYEALRELKKKHVPVAGIGFQMHEASDKKFSFKEMAAIMKKFVALGLEVHITEYDYALNDSENEKEAFSKQAEAYAQSVFLCRTIAGCKAFVTWGFTDKHSWATQASEDKGRAAFIDESYKPKPAFYEMKKMLQSGQ